MFKDTRRNSERVVEKQEHKNSHVTDRERSHPAFGLVSASRVSGGHTRLFGSPLVHNGYIKVQVQLAHELISNNVSRYHPTMEPESTMVEFYLSEVGWAEFVSTLNVGNGVPCTIGYGREKGFKQFPQIEEETDESRREADIKRAVEKQYKALKDALADFTRLMEQPKVGKTELKELYSKMSTAINHAASNMAFQASLLTEHNEDLRTSAIAEVTAMVQRMAMTFPQLAAEAPEMPRAITKTDLKNMSEEERQSRQNRADEGRAEVARVAAKSKKGPS